jgi:hypothetical protein
MIFMSQSGLVDASRQAEWDAWYLDHLAIMATVPGVLSAQRFTTSSAGHPPSLGLYTITSPDVFNGTYYQIAREHYRRNLFEGLDCAPEVEAGQVLLLEDLNAVPAGDASATSYRGHCLRSVGLDRSTPCRFVQVVPDAAEHLPHRAEVAVYRPVSARLAGKPA